MCSSKPDGAEQELPHLPYTLSHLLSLKLPKSVALASSIYILMDLVHHIVNSTGDKSSLAYHPLTFSVATGSEGECWINFEDFVPIPYHLKDVK